MSADATAAQQGSRTPHQTQMNRLTKPAGRSSGAGTSVTVPLADNEQGRPVLGRSALISRTTPYQRVADGPQVEPNTVVLVRRPTQPVGTAGESLLTMTGQRERTRFAGAHAHPLPMGRSGSALMPGEESASSTPVEDGAGPQRLSGSEARPEMVLPTSADHAAQPSLVAAYLRGHVQAELSASDPLNNYTFFVGASDLDDAEEAYGPRTVSGAERTSASQALLPAEVTAPFIVPPRGMDAPNAAANPINNPLSLLPSDPHEPFGSTGKEAGDRHVSPLQSTSDLLPRTESGRPVSGANASYPLSAADPLIHATTSTTREAPEQLNLREATLLAENLSRSFAANRQMRDGSSFVYATGSHASFGRSGDPATDRQVRMPMETPCHSSFAVPDGKAGVGSTAQPTVQLPPLASYINVDEFCSQPMPEKESCFSRVDLSADGVSWVAAWQCLKAEVFSRNILFGARVTLFAVLPFFVLTRHPSTASWFKLGALVPVLAGLSVRPNLGLQVIMAVIVVQTSMVVLVWGTVMNAIGAVNNTSGWWCAAIFGPFAASMLGDLMSKRFIMLFLIIALQMEHTPGGAELTFPSYFVRDFLLSMVGSLCASLLPYPILAVRQCADAMVGLHKLYGACVGNCMKAYWAPVNIDQRAALGLIPFHKIGDLTKQIRGLMAAIDYEPTEFNLNNILRGERLALMQRVKLHLYHMSAAAAQRVGEGQVWQHRLPKEVREFEKRVKGPAMETATEVIAVLSELGKYITPEDVATKIEYDRLYNKAAILGDIVDRERAQTFFLKHSDPDSTNHFLRTLAFVGSLVDIAHEIEKFEMAMRTFDPSKYPSFWRRSFNFLFYDNWAAFWEELPKRLTLATPRDERMLKDSIKYSLGFAVACAFTLNYDHTNVYYFGMAILVRLAQQTASETLSIGIYRICGLCIGACAAFITSGHTHNLVEETLLTMAFVFISMCFANHPVYCWGAQYCMVIAVSGLALAPRPALLMTRLVDNVFAFISFFLICTFMFPVDPIRVLWNTRTRILLNINAMVQSFVALGCCPVTCSGEEAAMFIAEARQTVSAQWLCLREYGDWMAKCEAEPTIRGGPYPHGAVARLLLYLSEAISLQDVMLEAMVRLHRPRTKVPSPLLHDIMELTRPFLHDAGKLIARYIQNMIDATEVPRAWSMEEALTLLWKGDLACRSLHRVTGHIQRSFFAAAQQMSMADKRGVIDYMPASMLFEALAQENDPRLLRPENEELITRLLAMSMHMSDESVVSRDDMQAFNAIVIVFDLLFRTLGQLLPHMVEIHEWEKSRIL